MIVKLIAPGIIPNDYVTVDLPGVPQRGDTVLVEWYEYPSSATTEEVLTVLGVTYSVELSSGIRHHGSGDLVEVTCGRTPDTYTVDVIDVCNACNVNIYRDSMGQEFKAGRCEHFPLIPPVESILERN